MNYYRRYAGDYLRDTAELSLAEHGAYCLLLDYYYSDEKALPLDHRTLYRMLRALGKDEQQAVDSVLARFFSKQSDGYHQKRVDHEIEVSRKARSNGKSGGRPPHKPGGDGITGEQTGIETGLQTGSKTGIETGSQTKDETQTLTGSGHPPTTNHQPPTASLQPPATSQGKVKSEGRASRLPPDWQIPPDWAAWAVENHGLGSGFVGQMADRFRDYWLSAAGPTARKADWQATWRNWVRREVDTPPRRTNGYSPAAAPRGVTAEGNRAAVAHWKPPELA